MAGHLSRWPAPADELYRAAEQTDEVKERLAETTPASLNPEELTLMDPACGSGHILVEAYGVFKAIVGAGVSIKGNTKTDLREEFVGIDIDKRAAQLTALPIMKGRSDDRKFLSEVQSLIYWR